MDQAGSNNYRKTSILFGKYQKQEQMVTKWKTREKLDELNKIKMIFATKKVID